MLLCKCFRLKASHKAYQRCCFAHFHPKKVRGNKTKVHFKTWYTTLQFMHFLVCLDKETDSYRRKSVVKRAVYEFAVFKTVNAIRKHFAPQQSVAHFILIHAKANAL